MSSRNVRRLLLVSLLGLNLRVSADLKFFWLDPDKGRTKTSDPGSPNFEQPSAHGGPFGFTESNAPTPEPTPWPTDVPVPTALPTEEPTEIPTPEPRPSPTAVPAAAEAPGMPLCVSASGALSSDAVELALTLPSADGAGAAVSQPRTLDEALSRPCRPLAWYKVPYDPDGDYRATVTDRATDGAGLTTLTLYDPALKIVAATAARGTYDLDYAAPLSATTSQALTLSPTAVRFLYLKQELGGPSDAFQGSIKVEFKIHSQEWGGHSPGLPPMGATQQK